MKPIVSGPLADLQRQIDELKRTTATSAAVTRAIAILSGTVAAALANGGGGGLSSVSHDITLAGAGTSGDPLSASPLSGTVNSAILALSGTIAATDLFLASSITSNVAALSGTVNSAIVSLSGTINARVVNLSGTVDGHFNALSGTIDGAIRAVALGSGTLTAASNIWDRPSNPHFLDEEFDNDVLSTRWMTASVSGVFVGGVNPYQAFANGSPRMEINMRRRSWMVSQVPSDDGIYGIYITSSAQYPLPTDDFAVWFRGTYSSRLSITPANNDFTLSISICPLRSTGVPDRFPFTPTNAQNFVSVSLNESDPGTAQSSFDIVESGVSKASLVGFDYFGTVMQQPSVEGVGIVKRGSVYYGWAIGSNGSPVFHGSASWTGSVGAIFLHWSNAGSVATQFPGNAWVSIDFIRFLSSSQFPP